MALRLKLGWAVVACSALCGPALAKDDSLPSAMSAADIHYYLPKTSVLVTATLVLRDCGKPGSPPHVVPSLAVSATGVADRSTVYTLSGASLESWRVKRNVTVSLNDNGTLSGVNSEITDQTPTIFGSVLKFVDSVVTPTGALAGILNGYTCNSETAKADAEAHALQSEIDVLRNQITGATPVTKHGIGPAEIKTDLEEIDALAARIASLRTGQLMISVTKELKLKAINSPTQLDWDADDLTKWFDPPKGPLAAAQPLFHFTYVLTPKANLANPQRALSLASGWVRPNQIAAPASEASGGGCPDDPQCSKTIVFRQPVEASLAIYGVGYYDQNDNPFSGKEPPLLVEDLPIAQWGDRSYLSLNAKLLQDRTVDLTVNSFGKVTALTWATEAKGATLANALGGASDTVSGLRKAFANETEVQQQADEVTKLDTQRKLNALLACREKLAAGGYDCPGTS